MKILRICLKYLFTQFEKVIQSTFLLYFSCSTTGSGAPTSRKLLPLMSKKLLFKCLLNIIITFKENIVYEMFLVNEML